MSDETSPVELLLAYLAILVAYFVIVILLGVHG